MAARKKQTTAEFAKLRALILNKSHVDLGFNAATVEKVVTLNHEALATFVSNTEANRLGFVNICFKLWDVFVDVSTPFKLPNKYIDKALEELFTLIFKNLYVLQTQTKAEGGNFVLNGVKGVGKTTVLRVLGIVAACLTPNVYPVYWKYEKDKKIQYVGTSCLAAATKQFYAIDFESITNFDTFVGDFVWDGNADTSKLLFLLDEFSTLYTEGNNQELGIDIVNEFRNIAREGDVFFVMAASKINVGKYIFPKDTDHESRRYPNLNCGLFGVHEVRPIRDLTSFQQFWFVCFSEVLSSSDAEACYAATGGVGRFIVQYEQIKDEVLPFDCVRFHANTRLWHVACTLLVKNIPTASILNYASVEDFDGWIDDLIFYNDGHHITFLLEDHKNKFREHLESEKLLEMAHVFHTQRKGFIGGSSGHSNEDFLCKFLPSLFGLRDESFFFKFNQTSVQVLDKDGTPMAVDLSDSSKRQEFLQNHSRCFIKWQVNGAETGLDRIWFNWDAQHGLLTLHAVQVKTGKDIQSITKGVIATQRSRRNASDCDDTCIAGILCKAERGFATLVPKLTTTFRCGIELGTVHICTNKLARKGYDEYFNQTAEVHQVSELYQQAGVPSTFYCALHDGTDWLSDIIPEGILQFI